MRGRTAVTLLQALPNLLWLLLMKHWPKKPQKSQLTVGFVVRMQSMLLSHVDIGVF